MPKQRLSSEERKHRILTSSLRVFASNGFAGATSKDLATAAGVSEALLYKYFPSKEVLYGELASLLGSSKETLIARLTSEPPNTDSFVRTFSTLARLILFGPPDRPKDDSIDRLIGQSLLGDGSFARAIFASLFEPMRPYLAACLDRAAAEGDLEAGAESPELRCTLFHHFVGAVALFSLPRPPVLPTADRELLLREVLLFAFRGIGLTEAAIARQVDFPRLELAFRQTLSGQNQP